MKYKVGDKVKLKSKEGLDELERQVEDLYVHPDAYKNAGSEQTILECNDGFYRYDASSRFWHESLFEGLVEEESKPKPKFKVGDSVEVLKSGNTYTISQMVFNGKEFVYTLSNNGNTVCWFSEDEMIECLVEEESKNADDINR